MHELADVHVALGLHILGRVGLDGSGRLEIEALDAGADEFVNKPFSIDELLARMRATMRRGSRELIKETKFQLGDVETDLDRHEVKKAGLTIHLTPKEFDLLVTLARFSGRVVTHRQILKTVWGPSHVEDTQYLRVFIGQLRQKIETTPETPSLIQTEPGVGYRIENGPHSFGSDRDA